ncbi:nucleotide exchange factor GrpE [Accumulibacter sp.]|uniref:nucleotide exchange factor GrpE n=1 Tax=Accumulibacter sp. TaxID=2053492 RepID=UPI0025E3E5B2|nr:nucleotide exchange factor GrpE [Accumulibacter sp.]MCM8594295.1 nucleotide exchange factor GrpE [Accumulibacter sp.]MCM8627882.1 nucleotide exchange factor GrpE [Accumulibacter sp.]MDS4048439.1 nucleotide exchange factor GrpE [Accumulibacter sp.]
MHANDTSPDRQNAPAHEPEIGAAPADRQSSEAPEAAVAAAPVAEQAPRGEDLLREAQAKADEYRDLWLRARAETENVRRRAQEDIAKTSKFAIDRFAGDLLPVKDSLEAALAADAPSIDSLRAGTELTLKQLIAAFEKSALTEVNPLGAKFDPHQHQAISVVASEQEPNTVVTVLQKGYLLAGRVLRPALVIVARAGA